MANSIVFLPRTATKSQHIRTHSLASVASPAGAKLGLRMTTLHEEPSTRNALAEEDSFSDPDYPEYETSEERKQRSRSTFRTRMTASKTLGSLTEIGGGRSTSLSSAAAGAAAATAASGHSAAGSTHAPNASAHQYPNAVIKHIVGTPSMTSSASSSGYGSQVGDI